MFTMVAENNIDLSIVDDPNYKLRQEEIKKVQRLFSLRDKKILKEQMGLDIIS